MTYAEFKNSIETMYKSVFPSSACDISIGPLGGDSIYVTYYLAGDQSEFPNRIALNDLFDITFCIFQDNVRYGDGVRLTDDTEMPEALVLDVNHKSIKTAPENQYMAYGSVSLPFRKTKGTPDKILSTLQRYAEITKQTLTELYELEKLPTNQHPEVIEFVKGKLGLTESKQVNNMKIKFNKIYNKYQVVTPDGRVLEEFDTEKEATDWASKQKDFVIKKETSEDTAYKFNIVLYTSDTTSTELQKLTHHIDYLISVDELEYPMTFSGVTVIPDGDDAVIVSGYLDIDEDDIDTSELADIIADAIYTDEWSDIDLELGSVSVTELKEEDVEYISQKELDDMPADYKTTVGDTIKYSWEDKEMLRKKYKELGYEETDPMILARDDKLGTILKPVKVKETEAMNGFNSENSTAQHLYDEFVEFEEIDADKWNSAKSQEERDKMVLPFVKKFYKEHRDKIDDNWDDFLELLEYWNFHTEYKLFNQVTNEQLDESKGVKTESIQSVADIFNKIRGVRQDIEANNGKLDYNFYEKTSEIEEDIARLSDDEKEIVKGAYNELNNLYSHYAKSDEIEPVREAVEQPENTAMTTPIKNHAHCNECLEDFEYEFDPKNEVSNDIEIYTKGNGYAYYVECPNCGNLVEVPAEELDLVVTKLDDVTRDGFYMEVMDKHTARKCWYEVWRDGDDWNWDYNQYMFHLDNTNDIIAKMFQEELNNYSEEILRFVYDTVEEEKLDELEEVKKSVNEKAKKLREKKAKKLAKMEDYN